MYKGLGAVVTGIVPKMAIRFASFEAYKDLLANKETGKTSSKSIFLGQSRFGASARLCRRRELTSLLPRLQLDWEPE